MSAADTSLRGSATERVRRLLPLLDEHGAEGDRRRELTPEVVKALVEEDMLRLLLPRSIGTDNVIALL
jgi:indole-3-acetate monooxygenase